MAWDIGALQVSAPDIGALQAVGSTTTTKTITAKAKIAAVANQTIPAKARIQKIVEQTITAKARITPEINTCIDFEDLDVGSIGPWPDGFVSTSIRQAVIAAGGPNASGRYLQLPAPNGNFLYQSGFPFRSMTMTLNWTTFGFNGTAIAFVSTDNYLIYQDLFRVIMEPDGTYSFWIRNELVGRGPATHLLRWYWLQVNVRMEIIAGSVWIFADVYADGTGWGTSMSADTGFAPGDLLGGVGFKMIRFVGAFQGSGIDNLCLLPYTEAIIFPNEGDPHMKAAHGFIELPILPDDSDMIAAHGVIELPILPDDPSMIAAHGIIELILKLDEPPPPPEVTRRVPPEYIRRRAFSEA